MLRLKVTDLRSIKKADITIGGITVLAGENGSGKSTISKLLFEFIQTCINYDKLAEDSLKSDLKEIARTIMMILDAIEEMEMTTFDEIEDYNINKIDDIESMENFRKLERFLRYAWRERRNYTIEELSDGLKEAIDFLSNKSISKKVVEEYLRRMLHRSNLLNIGDKTVGKSTYSLGSIKEVINKLKERLEDVITDRPFSFLEKALEDNDLVLNDKYQLYEDDRELIKKNSGMSKRIERLDSVREVIYIDTPMVISKSVLSHYLKRSYLTDLDHWEALHYKFLNKNEARVKMIDPEKKKKIDHFFTTTMRGDVDIDQISKQYRYEREDGQNFELAECASGLKSFAILRYLFKNKYLHRDTLLILDEPESHLHPEWVVEYARLVVLLNKELGVKFLISSHHSNMANALRDIAKKEKIHQSKYNEVRFYFAKKTNSKSFSYQYQYLKANIDKIFDSFYKAFDKIDKYGEW